jgi:hypothetical protein
MLRSTVLHLQRHGLNMSNSRAECPAAAGEHDALHSKCPDANASRLTGSQQVRVGVHKGVSACSSAGVLYLIYIYGRQVDNDHSQSMEEYSLYRTADVSCKARHVGRLRSCCMHSRLYRACPMLSTTACKRTATPLHRRAELHIWSSCVIQPL